MVKKNKKKRSKFKLKQKSWYLPITLETKTGVLHNIHKYYLQKRSKKLRFFLEGSGLNFTERNKDLKASTKAIAMQENIS